MAWFLNQREECDLISINIRPEENISELLRNDPDKGFRILVEKYSSRLYWHIRRLVILHEDADDALQNTFINAWRSIGDFRNESSLYTWLYTIATNEALSLINKRKKNTAMSFDDLGSHFANSIEGSAWFDGDAAQVKLQNAILQLPEKQRIVFNMKYYDDITYEDMSKVLNTSVGALKASYHHAVKKIEQLISGN
jgi:RNA polymerase sigma-70 factor, ECF subfamily